MSVRFTSKLYFFTQTKTSAQMHPECAIRQLGDLFLYISALTVV